MSEQSYTLKEMVSKVLDQNEQILIAQARTLIHAENVDTHLTKLNSKVASNVAKISELDIEFAKGKTYVKAYTVAVSTAFGFIITGVNLFLK